MPLAVSGSVSGVVQSLVVVCQRPIIEVMSDEWFLVGRERSLVVPPVVVPPVLPPVVVFAVVPVVSVPVVTVVF